MTEEDYLLVCLAEECAETGQAISKSLRFGLDHVWPGKGVTNREAVRDELRDVFRLAQRLGLNDFSNLPDKGEKFARMMELSRSLGRLENR
jgi:NTP pyrophosphatase (non-canonical NTP hydrolase)